MPSTLNLEPRTLNSRPRRAFTLTELLIVIMIIGLMASLALAALAGATELAREQRTRAIIAKLDQLINERYEGYRTRAVPLSLNIRQQNLLKPQDAARARLNGLRSLMRMELPDRRTDILNYNANPPQLQGVGTNVLGMTNAALQRTYFRTAVRMLGGTPGNANTYGVLLTGGPSGAGWTEENEGSECLYLIISTMHDGDKNALDFFLPGEVGDIDEDGMKEILDGWGRPIQFLRWAPGFTTTNGALTTQISDGASAPDPFDPLKVDPRWGAGSGFRPYVLRPLIYSAGRDGAYDIDRGAAVIYAQTTPMPNDPYGGATSSLPTIGMPFDLDGDGIVGAADNITNHYQETP
jgi:prepilin-type N-terminal cleavage/methylation domain-containing protein